MGSIALSARPFSHSHRRTAAFTHTTLQCVTSSTSFSTQYSYSRTALPKPLAGLVDSVTQLPQISEANILSVARTLSEDIGFRTVGTYEHALGDTWMAERANEMQKECQRIVAATGRKLQCEVWHQRGSGSHR